MKSPAPARPQPKRGDCKGWTREATRSNTDFLQSVETKSLTGHGFALSLTVRDCPKTPQEWQKARRRFVERLRAMGMVRMHWLTEWQRRQVPHLHAAVWFGKEVNPADIVQHWVKAAALYAPKPEGQHIGPITGPAGWFEYLAKHAARGVSHYQRSPELVPPQWQGKTGRMWGKLGSWTITEAKEIDLPLSVWHQMRRLSLRYQIGKARRQRDLDRVRYFRRYRSKAPKETSHAQALPRLWIPEDDQWRLVASAFGSHGNGQD